ncbi:hypothetical protein D9757_014161 [Collybiopsis confluens]|uniref:Hikeshi-like domain-containing protein n=1 Tax=Collybiopsis confluens TaxID=2823264 RepID=A0A8H5CK82_9AGAR|nr:hypothetical protein D9757_014161 [Collybiopsis confluens]
MFGCLVAGRLLQTNLQQIDETHAVFELSNASTINHVCVFLLGNVPFPEGYGATVHLHWPGRGFQLLGMLSNDKPSAIFRLRASFTYSTTTRAFEGQGSLTVPSEAASNTDVTAVLGISIEPLSQIYPQISSIHPNSAGSSNSIHRPLPNAALLAERIVRHLLNYLSSFAASGLGPDVAVPISIIEKWYVTFTNKVKNGGTEFLEREVE